MIKRLTFICVCVLLIIAACKNKANNAESDFLANNIDTTVNPAEDFFEYAEGMWLKQTEIPAEESSWGIGNLVKEEIYNRLKKINEDAAIKKATKGVEQQIGDFWYSGMDSASLEKQGLSPLEPELKMIENIKDPKALGAVVASFHKKGINVMFGDYVAQDDKNSEVYAYMMIQGGLGMPNREYYFNTDKRTEGVRSAYKKYLVDVFSQLNNDSAAAQKAAVAVYTLEEKLANNSRKLADLRDPYKNYNKMDIGMLASLCNGIDWKEYFNTFRINKLDSVIVGQPEFYKALSNEIRNTPIDVWKNYLRFHVVKEYAEYLDNKTFDSYFQFRKTLSGVTAPRPRWKRVIDAESTVMGEALGQIFVKEYFNETAKKRYEDLVENIRDAYKERITKLEWMSDSTKQKAITKLLKISKKVGYPEKWKDFSAMQIDRGAYATNMKRANEWWHNYMINKLGKPIDKTEWDMTPQEWNAYYNPSNNEIVLPAGIFAVPGKKDEELDDAFVYGYAGASTIGHEITHGFDDQGRQFDEKGNLRNWWISSDEKQFNERAKRIIQQFNEYVPVDTFHINGEATQGENIADLGGVLIGLDAFKKTETYKSGKKIAGLTPLQRYFLGYAYSWMFKIRKENLANKIMTDVHSPAKQRVNGPMVNIPEFYEAFNVKPGNKMYREDSLRVKIW